MWARRARKQSPKVRGRRALSPSSRNGGQCRQRGPSRTDPSISIPSHHGATRRRGEVGNRAGTWRRREQAGVPCRHRCGGSTYGRGGRGQGRGESARRRRCCWGPPHPTSRERERRREHGAASAEGIVVRCAGAAVSLSVSLSLRLSGGGGCGGPPGGGGGGGEEAAAAVGIRRVRCVCESRKRFEGETAC